MTEFKLVAPFEPVGDQPQAIRKLVESLNSGLAVKSRPRHIFEKYASS
jgi:excinuclease UvrABC helicase subunit UvrB